jgi:hypothetical protein
MDPFGRGNQRVAVGDIRLDGDSAIAQLLSEGIDPIHPPRQQRDPVAIGGQRSRGSRTDA